MNRFFKILILTLFVLVAIPILVSGQTSDTVPTLMPPTLVPNLANAESDALLTQSSVAQIQAKGVFRAGILYNEPPYGELSVRGDLRGYDADLAILLAETWGVEIEFRQVTRQNAQALLGTGAVDAVFSAFIHHRSLDTSLEFSQTYLLGQQALMVLSDSEFTAPNALINQKIGYVLGTRAEQALVGWFARLGLPSNGQYFLTMDQAYVALAQNEIAAVIGERQELLNLSASQPDLTRILDDPVSVEPRAIAIRRQDINMRNLINRTLQYLAEEGELEVLFAEYFAGEDFPEDTFYLWNNIGETPLPENFGADVPYPQQYALPRVLDSGVLRVAGLTDLPDSPTESDIRFDNLNRALVNEIASRWGVSVQFIASTPEIGIGLVQDGQADIVVGVEADWRFAESVDFAAPYLLHGDRLMVPSNTNIEGFNELRGQWIGVMIGDEGAQERAKEWADSINATVNFYQSIETDAALTILEDDNADVIYGNSLKLIPHLEAYPNNLRLTERWYSRSYYSIGVPRNDIDFRMLLEYTVQEMIVDGTLKQISNSLILADELPEFDIWPGDPKYAGISVSA